MEEVNGLNHSRKRKAREQQRELAEPAERRRDVPGPDERAKRDQRPDHVRDRLGKAYQRRPEPGEQGRIDEGAALVDRVLRRGKPGGQRAQQVEVVDARPAVSQPRLGGDVVVTHVVVDGQAHVHDDPQADAVQRSPERREKGGGQRERWSTRRWVSRQRRASACRTGATPAETRGTRARTPDPAAGGSWWCTGGTGR